MYLIQHQYTKYWFDGQKWQKGRFSAKVYNETEIKDKDNPWQQVPVSFINAVTNQIEIYPFKYRG